MLWASNLPALRAFLAVATQMRWVPLASGGVGLAGIDYQGARAGLDLAGHTVTPDMWSDIRQIEMGAMMALNRREA